MVRSFSWLFALVVSVVSFSTALASSGKGLFLDGDGHYSLRGETRTSPAFSKKRGTHQAIDQDFRLKGEARFDDVSSFFMEMRVFGNRRASYLGDSAQPKKCQPIENGKSQTADTEDCEGRHQDTNNPGYKPLTPMVTQAYVRYGFEYCLVEAGRRARGWGMGLLLDRGEDPFDIDSSTFDGVTCDVNIQKSQTLGFSLGYDKLAESGTYIDNPYTVRDASRSEYDGRDDEFGATNKDDDIDQFFFTINYDDRKANAGTGFTKEVGVYFANITASKKDEFIGADTDLKFLDVYTGLYFSSFAWRNELVLRTGKSKDPNWQRMGGKREDSAADPAQNKLQSVGLGGEFQWTIDRSGTTIGPAIYRQGDATRHALFADYVYAPGDNDGYYDDERVDHGEIKNDSGVDITKTTVSKYGHEARKDNNARAMAFHPNFKPALLMFNGRPNLDDLSVDGVYNPSQVMNVTLFGLGYRLESLDAGDFEVKLITGQLQAGMPSEIKNHFERNGRDCNTKVSKVVCAEKPFGYYGKDLGYELDLKYGIYSGRDLHFGLAGAIGLPGKAWQIEDDSKPAMGYLLQSHVSFLF